VEDAVGWDRDMDSREGSELVEGTLGKEILGLILASGYSIVRGIDPPGFYEADTSSDGYYLVAVPFLGDIGNNK
jgi:hypothetical protein